MSAERALAVVGADRTSGLITIQTRPGKTTEYSPADSSYLGLLAHSAQAMSLVDYMRQQDPSLLNTPPDEILKVFRQLGENMEGIHQVALTTSHQAAQNAMIQGLTTALTENRPLSPHQKNLADVLVATTAVQILAAADPNGDPEAMAHKLVTVHDALGQRRANERGHQIGTFGIAIGAFFGGMYHGLADQVALGTKKVAIHATDIVDKGGPKLGRGLGHTAGSIIGGFRKGIHYKIPSPRARAKK